ncbi:MAG: HEAT repeat domain-containing protein [Phycisphaerae bacterium]
MPLTRRILAAALIACLLGSAAVPAPAAEVSVEQAMKDLPKYEFGQSRAHLTVIHHALRDADKAKRARMCDGLAQVLGSGATEAAKRWIFRQISIFGTKEQVPEVAALLLDEKLSDMARYALQRIDDPSALEAMRNALPKANAGQKIGLINSLGERGDEKAVDSIIKAMNSGDEPVAIAAARALAKIGGAKAVEALGKARAKADGRLLEVVQDAWLRGADGLLAAGKKDAAAEIYHEMYKPNLPKHVRLAALRGIIAAGGEKTMPLLTEILTGTDRHMQASALRFLREVAGPEVTRSLADLLPKLPAETQVLVLEDFAVRGNPAVLPAVKKAAKSQNETVKKAAVAAMGQLGDASCVPILTDLAAGGGPAADAARQALDSLPAKDVNPAMIRMAKEGDPKVRKEVVRSLGARVAATAVPALLDAARDADTAVRHGAIRALEPLAGASALPQLVALVVNPRDEGDRGVAQNVLASVCGRVKDKEAAAAAILGALDAAPDAAKAALLQTLPRAGTDKALAAVRKYAGAGDETIRDKAVRALAGWPDPAAADDLLKIATSSDNKTHQVLALRGYIRLAGADRLKTDRRLQMYEKAMKAATRDDEKRQVLGGLGDVKAVEALKMAMPALDQKPLQNEACAAAVKIAKNLGGHGKETIREAMKKVLAVSKNNRLRGDAQKLLKKAGG